MSDPIAAMIAQTFARGLAMHRAGKPAMAEAIYRTVLEIAPGHPEATEALYVARMNQGDADAACAYWAHLFATGRTDPAPFLFSGAFERSQGQTGRARACVRVALALAPDSAEAWHEEGVSAAHDLVYAEAARALVRATHIDPGRAASIVELGTLYLKAKLPDVAIPRFQAALALAESTAARHGLARALLARGDAGAALAEFELAVQCAPADAEGWLGGVEALRALGRDDDAAARLSAMADRFAGQVDTLLRISRQFLELGRDAPALDAYRAAAAADPQRATSAAPRVLRRCPASALCAGHDWPYHRVNPPHAATYVDDTGARHEVMFPEVFLARVDAADVVTSTWAVACGDTLLLDGLLHFPPERLHSLPEFAFAGRDGRMLVDLDPPGATIAGEAILLGGFANWAHLVQEWLSRLTVLERFPALNHLPILVMPGLMRSVHELVGLLGVDTARLVPVPDASVVRVERLWIPSLTHQHKYASPLHIDFLRRRLAPQIAEGMRRPRRRLYLSRQTATYRALVNEAEILEALAPLGVEPVVPEDHSMAEQVALFASAELVVGPLGGGSAAILFAPPGAGFVELTHSQLMMPQYGMLTATLHQRYRRLVGRTLANRGGTSYDFDFSVPAADVVAACRALLDEGIN